MRIDGQAAARARRIADGSAPARRRAHRRRRPEVSRRRFRPRRRRRWMRALASGCRCRASPPADQLLACAGTILSWCCCCESCTPWKHRSLRSICQHFTCEHHHLRNQARNAIAKPRALRLRLIVELVKVESPDVRKATAAIFSDCIAPLLFGGACSEKRETCMVEQANLKSR